MNYQLELERTLEKVSELDTKPTLLLHACCGPCSSYVLEYLNNYGRSEYERRNRREQLEGYSR